jgi:DNA-binding PadR family transcriptional regulator
LLVLVSGDCSSGDPLGQDAVAAELASMERDGLLTAGFDGGKRDYSLTDEGWEAAAHARRSVIEAQRLLGVLQDRYAALCPPVRS